MSDRVFFDTNVLVYAFDQSEPEKQRISSELVRDALDHGSGVISTQVLSEFFVTTTKKVAAPLSTKEAADIARDLASMHVIELGVRHVLEAMRRIDELKLSYWDALIIVAARTGGCGRLLTEDLHHGAVLDGISIENPFRKAKP